MIRCQQLCKSFRIFEKQPGLTGTLKSFFHRQAVQNLAVDEFSVEIEQGELVGLLGPNGAGKTTLMKMLTGIIVPSRGEVAVIGHRPWQRSIAFRKQIALVMGQKSQLWWDIPAMDSFLLLQRYYEIDDKGFRDRLCALTELLEVTKLLKVHVRKLSLGERMKLELIACLLHQPKVIFLDEPTIGLDLVAQKNIREFLTSYHREHRPTIVLTSHYMANVEALCSRIVLIIAGSKRFDGKIRAFEQILGKEKFVTFRFATNIDPNEPFWQDLHPTWNDSFNQVELRIPEDKLRITSAEVLRVYPVCDFQTEKMPVERVMKTLLSSPNLVPESTS